VQIMENVAVDRIVPVSERTLVTPQRLILSVNSSVQLQTAGRGSFQWRFEGDDLAGQTNSILVLTNLVAEQDGRYSVVVSNASLVVTNFTYLTIDPTFTKVTEGPVVTDQVKSWAGMFGDYDGDGLPDLVVLGDYFVTGKNTRLYRNLGGGRFEAVTDSPWDSLTDRIAYSPWADVDNDGDLDLFLIGNRDDQPVLMENEGGGVFTRQMVGPDWASNQIQIRGFAAAWGDLDNDGLLDAVVGDLTTYPLRNNGDGTFTIMTNNVVYPEASTTHCLQLIDYDGDGDLDLFTSEEGMNSRLYRNEGHWEFTNVTESVLQNRLPAGWNGAWGDFDNDGDLDLYFMGWTSSERFLINNGDGTFADWTGYPKALMNVSAGMPSWGDFDNDGLLDLLITQAGSHCRLFRNTGDGDFLEVLVGSPVVDLSSAQSAAWADYDNDGDLDLFLAGNASQNYLYQNNGSAHHWLKIRLKGTASNSHGIGARIFAQATINGELVSQMRQITAGMPQELEAHFGLGNARKATLLRVEWPSGAIQEWTDVSVEQVLTLWEPPAPSAAVRPNGACVLSIRAQPNRGWQIQASNDLSEWQTLTTMTSGTVGFEFVDSTATGMDCRFYRVMPE
jgi:enediyne biosynthesis protein E4